MATGEISQIETGNRRADPAFSVVARIARGIGVDLGLVARRLQGDDVPLTSQSEAKAQATLRRELSRAVNETARATERIQNVLDAYPSEKDAASKGRRPRKK